MYVPYAAFIVEAKSPCFFGLKNKKNGPKISLLVFDLSYKISLVALSEHKITGTRSPTIIKSKQIKSITPMTLLSILIVWIKCIKDISHKHEFETSITKVTP